MNGVARVKHDRRWMTLGFAALALAAAPLSARAGWLFQPSTYSHDPQTGERVAQYQPVVTTYYRNDPTYMESGYRQQRFALRGPDGSYDYQHVVQTWGLGELIRPYGEWEYPYRAGATPFGPWGNAQGPWTLPFDSWRNPYGLGRLPNAPWYLYNPYNPPLSGGWNGTSPPQGIAPGMPTPFAPGAGGVPFAAPFAAPFDNAVPPNGAP